jgi:hypothetical protein
MLSYECHKGRHDDCEDVITCECECHADDLDNVF